MTTSDKIYRVNLWRFGTFGIDTFDVVKRTAKSVKIKVVDIDRFGDHSYTTTHRLSSRDYAFFDTMEDAERAAENVITLRLRYEEDRVEKLRTRLQEVCRHKAITGPSDGRCVRCNFKVPNPDDYRSGG